MASLSQPFVTAACPLTEEALLTFLHHIDESKLAVNSIIVQQNGFRILQAWRKPYRPHTPQLLFSLSKSFTAVAAGIAWDEGLIRLEDPVVSFFPDKLPDIVSDEWSRMTIHHLLAMNTGHEENIYGAVAAEEDWIKAFLAQKVQHEPGTWYRYNTHATYMLSAILTRVTGMSLVDYLTPRLFKPLGIPRPVWETCPMGITAGGMGLSVPTEGIASFGELLLNQGMFGGKRILSEAFIRLATSEQSDNRRGEARPDFGQGYGYQLFLSRRGCFMGNGSYGQVCFVAPANRLVIAATSSFSSMKELQTLLDFVHADLLETTEDKPQREEGFRRVPLTYTFSTEPLMDSRDWTHAAVTPIPDAVYVLEDNPEQIRSIVFQAVEEGGCVTFQYDDRDCRSLPFTWTLPVERRDLFTKDLALHEQEVVTVAERIDERTFSLRLTYVETPYQVRYTFRFDEDVVEVAFNFNVSLSLVPYSVKGRINL